MNFFLTSSPNYYHQAKFIPDNGFIDLLRASIPDNASYLFVASSPEDIPTTERYAAEKRATFENEGFRVGSFDILDCRTADRAEEMIRMTDVLILSGGHVPTQNEFFKSIDLRRILKDFDGTLISISAGTMNSAETVYSQPELDGEAVDPDYKRFFPGLGLTKAMVLPHYQDYRDSVLDGMRVYEDITYPDSMGRCFYALIDGSFIYIHDGVHELCGEAYAISDGKLTKLLDVGQKMTLEL